MNPTDWRRCVAHFLLLAELDFRLAQRTFDGTARARRWYRAALEQLRRAEAEALEARASAPTRPP